VAAGGHAVDADTLQVEQGRETHVAAQHVDGARDFQRAAFPALGADLAVVAPVVAGVFGQGHHKTGAGQGQGQIALRPGLAPGAVRDHDEAAVATLRSALWCDGQRETAALHGLGRAAGGVEDGDGAVVLAAGQFVQAHGGLGSQAQEGAGSQEGETQQLVQGGGVHGVN